MLRSIIVVAAVANLAMAAVADVCVQHPYHQMHRFKDYAPAKAHCAAHYPVHIVTKTVEPRCLTTTKSEIIRTETVTARRTQRCPTKYHTRPDSSMNPVPTYGHHHHHHLPPNYGGHHPSKYEGHHHPSKYHHPEPVKYYHKRDAAPEPTPDPKHGHKATGYEWEQYHGELKKCGYDCVQKACSCVATKKTVTHTPKPTCTKTIHTAGVHTETKTVYIQEDCHRHGGEYGYGSGLKYGGGGYGGGHHGYGKHENHGYGKHESYPKHHEGYPKHYESYPKHHESYPKHYEGYEKHHESYPKHHESSPKHYESPPKHYESYGKHH